MKQSITLLFCLMLVGCESNQKPIAIWQHSANGTSAAAISFDGSFALVSGYNEPSGWWDLTKNARIFNWRMSSSSISGHDSDPVQVVNIDPDASRAVTASLSSFAIWDTHSGKNVGFYKAPSTIRSIAISRKARFVLLGMAQGKAIFMSLKTGKRLEFLGHQLHAEKLFQDPTLLPSWVGINSVDLSANGQYALTGGDDHAAILWNTQSGQQIYLWPHNNRVHYVKLSRDGKFAFTASRQAEAFIWDLSTGKIVSKLKLKSREWIISSARFSADNKQLLTGSPGRDLKLWQVTSGQLLKSFKVKKRFSTKASGAVVLDVAFTKDGNALSEASSGYGEKWPLNHQ